MENTFDVRPTSGGNIATLITMSEKCNGVKAVVYFTWENKILAVKP
jgi:hypothetical protein